MALVVEDGTGKSNAESYISVADATTYHAARGNSAWAALASDTVREQLLRKATDYMLQAYREKWKGYRYVTDQALDWPRAWVYKEPFYQGAVGTYPFLVDSDIVPTEVKNACAELALKASSATLMEDQEQLVVKEKVDVIEVEYSEFSPQGKRYKSIDATLSIYFKMPIGISVGTVRT